MPFHLMFGGLFTLVGLMVIVFLTRNLICALRSLRWPCVSGQLLKAGTRRVTMQTNNHLNASAATLVDFAYTYDVEGQSYQSSRVTFSDNIIKTGGMLNKLQDEFRKGELVKVFYDPSRPGLSVLKPGPTVYNFTPFITAILFLATGIIALFFHEQALQMIA